MKIIFIYVLLVFPLFLAAGEDTAARGKTILEESDRLFYPETGTYDIDVSNVWNDGTELNWSIEVYKNGREKQSCVWTEPRIMRNDVGMRVGDAMYHKLAKWHKPDIVSYQSVFMESNFSWGDIMASDIAYDYEVTDILEITEEERKLLKLVLKPLKNGHYARIDIWVTADTHETVKRIYYTASQNVFKRAVYSDIIRKKGKIISFTVTMYHEFLEIESIALVGNITIHKSLPNFLFNPDEMARLKASQ